MDESAEPYGELNRSTNRRSILKLAVGAGLGLPLTTLATAAVKPPHKMRPQAGDLIIYRFGARQGRLVKPEDIPPSTDMVQALTMEPNTRTIRDGSRLNGLLLVRFKPEDLSEPTRALAANGIVAYSSVCNHQGCDLTQWLAATQTFQCYCHYSQFDATDEGRPVKGPSRRKLAILPLKLEDGLLKVAGLFRGKVGFKRKMR